METCKWPGCTKEASPGKVYCHNHLQSFSQIEDKLEKYSGEIDKIDVDKILDKKICQKKEHLD